MTHAPEVATEEASELTHRVLGLVADEDIEADATGLVAALDAYARQCRQAADDHRTQAAVLEAEAELAERLVQGQGPPPEAEREERIAPSAELDGDAWRVLHAIRALVSHWLLRAHTEATTPEALTAYFEWGVRDARREAPLRQMTSEHYLEVDAIVKSFVAFFREQLAARDRKKDLELQRLMAGAKYWRDASAFLSRSTPSLENVKLLLAQGALPSPLEYERIAELDRTIGDRVRKHVEACKS